MRDPSRHGWIGAAILWNLVFVLPIAVLFIGALAARWSFPEVVPHNWNGRGFTFLVTNSQSILRALGSSLAYSFLVVISTIALTVFPASVFARYEFRGRRALEALLVSPVLIPAITYAMGLQLVMIRIGLSDTVSGVVVVLTATSYPYMLRALTAGFGAISEDLDRCAANLGAGAFRRLCTVSVPLLFPAMLSGGSVVFLVAFSDYFLVFLIGGGAVRSFTGYLLPFLSSADRPPASALTLVFLVLPVVLFFVTDRFVASFYHRRGMV
jgi:putative spermidine/putrescine transport system permease protein